VPAFSLNKNDKITKRTDYLRIGSEGARLRTKNFIVLYSENSSGHCRFGVTATKKIGNAVKRNRIKRLLREFFRLNRNCFRASTDFIFIAGKGSVYLGYTDIRDELLGALGRRRLLRVLHENSC